MNARQSAPMSARKHVVRGVIPVVQKQPIHNASGQVSRVIELGMKVTILMLQKVDRDQHPLRK